MPPETDIDTLHALHRCSTPERWAAFMALAGYLVKHPEQRLGQAVVNTLMPRTEACDHGFVIMFDDGTYNSRSGYEVPLCEADHYASEAEAQTVAASLYGVEGILPAVDLAQPDLFYMTDDAASRALAVGQAGALHKEYKGLLAFAEKCVREDVAPAAANPRRTLDGCVVSPKLAGCTSESLPCGRSKCGVCYDLE